MGVLSISNQSKLIANVIVYGDGYTYTPPNDRQTDGIEVYTCPPVMIPDPEVETVNRTIHIQTTGNDITGDGTSVGTAFATLKKALQDIKPILRAVVTIQFGAGTFNWTDEESFLLEDLRIQAKNAIGKLNIFGTYTTIETGLNMSAGSSATGDLFTLTNSIDNSWTDDEHIGNFICPNGLPDEGYPIIKSGTNWIISPINSNRSHTAATIHRLDTIFDITAKNVINRMQLMGTNNLIFEWLRFDCSARQAFNNSSAFANLRLLNCSIRYTKSNDKQTTGTYTNLKHDFSRVYVEVNHPSIINYYESFKVAGGQLDYFALNNIGTLTYGQTAGLNIQGEAEIIGRIAVRNFAHGIQVKENGTINMTEGSLVLALDCGTACRFYEGGGVIGFFRPTYLMVKNCDYLVCSRSLENITFLTENSLIGSPDVQAIQPSDATWNGFSLGVNQLAVDQVSDIDRKIFISYP